MSSFGSSLINKSGRRIVPRAVTRRKPPLPDAQDASAIAASLQADVVTSIEPIATGSDVLQAQIDAQIRQENVGASQPRANHVGASAETAVSTQSHINSAQDLTNVVRAHAEADGTSAHRQKRVRLSAQSVRGQEQPATTQFLPSDGSEFADRGGQLSNARVTRSRAANAASLPTPDPSQHARVVDARSTSSRGRADEAANASAESMPSDATDDGTSIQPIDDANWVVTTQDQIRQRTDASKRRQASRPSVAEISVPTRPDGAVVSETHQLASSSSRLANLQKRKRKKQALQSLMTSSVAPSSDSLQVSRDVNADNIGETAETVEQSSEQAKDNVDETVIAGDQAPRKPRKRAATPEELESVTIVDSLVTMAELSARERKYGKKSDRERKMRLIDWALVKARRREEEIRLATERGRHRNVAASNADDDEDEGDLENEENLDAALSRVAARNRARRRGTGIRIRVVNGEHVIDEQSQRVDRHALANEDLDALEEVEEEELTQRFNSQTYINMKRRDPADRLPMNDRWTSASTDKFYDCLRRFGTDFMIISKMFPGRTRRQIKAKFVREERTDLKRVHDALYNGLQVAKGEDDERQTWNLDVFRENAGIEMSQLLDPREVERELESVRKVREVAIALRRKETEEMKRQRRLAGEVSSDEEEEEQQKPTEQTSLVGSTKPLADDELEEVEEFG